MPANRVLPRRDIEARRPPSLGDADRGDIEKDRGAALGGDAERGEAVVAALLQVDIALPVRLPADRVDVVTLLPGRLEVIARGADVVRGVEPIPARILILLLDQGPARHARVD